ncbi:MAG: RNA polymerase sigma factor RpoD/SigA [Candidatus Brocadiaceae bacterium]|nr:RNA polymerase sigma factor RpoD/SigA [Candidatus Brocadiaceae bacterium]
MRPEGQESALAAYLREVAAHPLLTKDRERELAVAHRRDGDAGARERLILSNLRLVVSIAREYAGRGVELTDLIAEGNLGLLHAVDRFDPERGVRFSTHATWWIRRAIRRAVRSSARTIRIPAYMADIVARAKQTQAELQGRLGREPSMEELADEMALSGPRALFLQRALAAEPASLYENLGDGPESDMSLAAMLAAPESDRPDRLVFERMEMEALRGVLEAIDEREARILSLRFGLGEDGPLTLRAAGRRMGLSRERVRQIEKEALGKLKEALGGQG